MHFKPPRIYVSYTDIIENGMKGKTNWLWLIRAYSESQKMVGDLTVMCEDFRSYITNPSFRITLICAENFVQDYKQAPSFNEKGNIYI